MFKIHSEYKPSGDQPQAIEQLAAGIMKGERYQTLLGVTGSGKTFTMANVIEKVQKPTLILAHNKTLAGQLYAEFKEIFPNSAVEYFVSYFDYYQPEAYIPHTDTYIEKDSSHNAEIERLRHSATSSLFERPDVLIVASVSCIYSLGDPIDYKTQVLSLREGMRIDRDEVIETLVSLQYERNDIAFVRNKFRVRGDTLEILPAYSSDVGIKIEFFGDEIDRISEFNALTGNRLRLLSHVVVYPASHFISTPEKLAAAIGQIEDELSMQVAHFESEGKLLEAQRIKQRTMYDLEMMREIGYCNGIENYSRVISGRSSDDPPFTLMDYFPDDYLLIIDESHVSVPQVRGMYNGDHARKLSLVNYGFRLPSALDNRPLTFDEFEGKLNQVVYVSATPAQFELEKSSQIVEQIVRPTGLLDPKIEVRPTEGQIENLMQEILKHTGKGNRVLLTTLTKKMAENLTAYLDNGGIKVRYLHHDIEALERIKIISDLRLGVFDVLVGINLLREGLDIPEVSLVAILDADKEGFLRSHSSLIQTIGRAARNSEGIVVMYADKITRSMELAISETNRRRALQEAHNIEHGITPKTVVKNVAKLLEISKDTAAMDVKKLTEAEILQTIDELTKEMKEAAKMLEFEIAADLRDKIMKLKEAKK